MNGITSRRTLVEGPAGMLETAFEHGSHPRFIGLVCHPHPLFGGTMDNKVVTTLARAARDEAGISIRFNFRGVGKSEGAYDEGRGEAEDLFALVQWARQEFPGLPFWLAGFSFGSHVALRVAERLFRDGSPATHLLLVAPPVHHFDFASVREVGCPVTVIQGEADEVVPAEQVFETMSGSALNPDIVRVPDTGHFFHGRLNTLRDIARDTFPA